MRSLSDAPIRNAISDVRFETLRDFQSDAYVFRLSWLFHGAPQMCSIMLAERAIRDAHRPIDPMREIVQGDLAQAECATYKGRIEAMEATFHATTRALHECHSLLRQHGIPIPGVDVPTPPQQES